MAPFSLWHHKQKALASGMAAQNATAVYEPLWTNAFLRVWLLNFIVCGWFFMIDTTFPFYVKHLGGTEMTVGLVAGGFSFASILMRPLAGWLLDHKSRSSLLKSGVVGLAAISALYLVAPLLALAVALRLISGLVFSGVSTASNTNACDTIPQSRFGEGVGFLGLGNTLTNALGPALGLMIMRRYGFPPLFTATALLALLAVLITQRLEYKKIQHRDYSSGRYRIKLSDLFNADALPASAVRLFSSAAFGGVSVFISLYGEFAGLGKGEWFFALVALGTGSTRLFSGHLADKHGEKPMVVVGNSCFLLGLLLLLFSSTPCYYLAGLFFGWGFGLSIPALQAMSLRIVPLEQRGSASSTFLCAYDVGAGLGGLVAGWLVTNFGYRPMFAIMIIFVVLSGLTYSLWAAKTPSAFKNYIRQQKKLAEAVHESA